MALNVTNHDQETNKVIMTKRSRENNHGDAIEKKKTHEEKE
jgi:hypothetical protein